MNVHLHKTLAVLGITALMLGVGADRFKGANLSQTSETGTVAIASTARDGVFIHVSHSTDDPRRLLMALAMADKMSEDKDVLVYLDIKAVEAVLKDSKDISFGNMQSSQTLLKKLVAKGVKLQVCPTCLSVAGKTPSDLMPGATIADKEAFFNFTQGRILSLDY